jgi:hypothetical protein
LELYIYRKSIFQFFSFLCKPKNVKKDVNLQALAREFSTIDNKDYLRRVGSILFKEYLVRFIFVTSYIEII